MFWRFPLRTLALKNWFGALAFGALVLGLTGSVVFAKELHIVTIDSAPFGFIGEDGKPTGMMYELGNLIAKEAGFTSTNEITPYARTALAVANGKADFVLRYSSDELAEGAHPIAGVLSLPTIIVGKPTLKLGALSDLHGKTVGRPRGGRFDDAFDADQEILKFVVSDYAQMFRMLMLDRLDAGIGSSVGLFYNAHLLGITKDQLGKPLVLSTQTFELHFSKKTADEATTAALKSAVMRLKHRNEIRKIVDKYMGSFDWSPASK